MKSPARDCVDAYAVTIERPTTIVCDLMDGCFTMFPGRSVLAFTTKHVYLNNAWRDLFNIKVTTNQSNPITLL